MTAGTAGVNMSNLEPGSVGAFESGEGKYVNTTLSEKSTKTYMFDEQSKYSIETEGNMDWQG